MSLVCDQFKIELVSHNCCGENEYFAFYYSSIAANIRKRGEIKNSCESETWRA